MSKPGDLATRMKRYESSFDFQLPPNSFVLARVDGRAFHTWARKAQKPFDGDIMAGMAHSTKAVVADIDGVVLAYTQSDEASFLFTDTQAHDTQGYFDYRLSKINSIIASTFTAHFNRFEFDFNVTGRLATFDCRIWIMPKDDVANYFVWRQQDWERNSITMLAQSLFSHKQLMGKNVATRLEMIEEAGSSWYTLDDSERFGTFVFPGGSSLSAKLDYDEVMDTLER